MKINLAKRMEKNYRIVTKEEKTNLRHATSSFSRVLPKPVQTTNRQNSPVVDFDYHVDFAVAADSIENQIKIIHSKKHFNRKNTAQKVKTR